MSAPGPVRAAIVSRTDWETPWAVFEVIDREFGFTLDAAASDANRKCARWLTEAENALAADWLEHRVFVNPPYGAGMLGWVKKCDSAAVRGATVVALVPNATETQWFREGALHAWEVRFVWPRIPFEIEGRPLGSSTTGSALLVWRPGVRPYPAPVMSYWSWK